MKCLSILLLLSACAFDSTITMSDTGQYVITSVESGGGAGANSLPWEVNHQGDKLCPAGFTQGQAHRVEREGGKTTYITTKCK
jgi:hypothetical protein